MKPPRKYSTPVSEPDELAGISLFNSLLSMLEKTTGLRVSFYDTSHVTYVINDLYLERRHRRHENPFCNAVKKSSLAYQQCVRCKALGKYVALKRKRPFTGRCHMGLVDFVYPLIFEGVPLGMIYLGSAKSPGEVSFPSNPPVNHRLARYGLKQHGLGDLWKELPRFSEDTITEAVPCLQAIETSLASYLKANGITPEIFRRRDEGALAALSATGSHWLVRAAKDYIESNYGHDINLSVVAEHLHVRSQHLSRVFSEEEHIPLTKYLNLVRVQKAKAMLLLGKLNITEVSSEVGYNDSGYFSRVFSQVEKLSPLEFVRKNKKAPSAVERATAKRHPLAGRFTPPE